MFRPPGCGTLTRESGGLRHRQRYVALWAKGPTNNQPLGARTEENKRTLIHGAIVVLPDQFAETNLLLEEGKIIAIDASRTSAAEEVIEGAGLHILPGVIDDQVHFREPCMTHKEDLETFGWHDLSLRRAWGVRVVSALERTQQPTC